jgi:hypothetical protein
MHELVLRSLFRSLSFLRVYLLAALVELRMNRFLIRGSDDGLKTTPGHAVQPEYRPAISVRVSSASSSEQLALRPHFAPILSRTNCPMVAERG